MGNPKGVNHGSHGKKGRSGRKSAFQENAEAQFLKDIWNGKYTRAELEDIIRSGKYGIKHMFTTKAMAGNERLISKLMDKLFRDAGDLDLNNLGSGEISIKIIGAGNNKYKPGFKKGLLDNAK